mgnify:CR=1 FL=1
MVVKPSEFATGAENVGFKAEPSIELFVTAALAVAYPPLLAVDHGDAR